MAHLFSCPFLSLQTPLLPSCTPQHGTSLLLSLPFPSNTPPAIMHPTTWHISSPVPSFPFKHPSFHHAAHNMAHLFSCPFLSLQTPLLPSCSPQHGTSLLLS